jgi:hypothetical protein
MARAHGNQHLKKHSRMYQDHDQLASWEPSRASVVVGQAKTQAECYHYLFKLAVELHKLGIDHTKVRGCL